MNYTRMGLRLWDFNRLRSGSASAFVPGVMIDAIVVTAAFAASLGAAVALERAVLGAWFWVIDPERWN